MSTARRDVERPGREMAVAAAVTDLGVYGPVPEARSIRAADTAHRKIFRRRGACAGQHPADDGVKRRVFRRAGEAGVLFTRCRLQVKPAGRRLLEEVPDRQRAPPRSSDFWGDGDICTGFRYAGGDDLPLLQKDQPGTGSMS